MSGVVLSFDDGRIDNYEIAMNILKPMNIKATFNITTGYVDKSIDKSILHTNVEAMSINNVIELFVNGFEIAAHSDTHINEFNDIKNGVDKLKKWLNVNEFGFASPNSQTPINTILTDKSEYSDLGIKYVRTALRNTDILWEKINRNLPFNKSFAIGYTNALNNNNDKFLFFSIPINYSTKFENVKCVIQHALKQDKDCILMLHSISDVNDNNWSWSKDNFINLCNFLKQNNINTMTNMDLYNKNNI